VLKRKLSARGQTPTGYLEGRVLRPLGLGAQRYMADSAGNPLLASGWKLTAREWAKMGQVALNGGAPVLSRVPLSIGLRGSPVNRAFAFGWWNNRAAPGGREFDIEDMLEPKWFRQDWRSTAISREAPADLMASIGSGYQRLFVIPSMSLVVVRQGLGGKFSDSEYLRLLLGK
jgi:CubicO group peptidase (beta-lactamase class C family)